MNPTEKPISDSMIESTSKGNCEQEEVSTSEKSSRKRKQPLVIPNNNFKKIVGAEMPVANENYISPQTAITVSPLLHEPTFTNSFSINFNDANQYNMVQQFPQYPINQWPDPRAPPRMCPSQPNADYYEPSSSGQLNSVPPVVLPENHSMYGISGLEIYNPYHCANISKPVIPLSSCILYPPSPDTKIKRNDKPPGCRTVFIGGLPEKITEDIIREAFTLCGKIVTVRMNTKNFCHVRFSCQEEVEQAFLFSGYRIKIENKDDKPYHSKLHVDYAVAKDDQHEAECAERLALRKARHNAQKEQEALEMNKPRVNPFSEVELQNLLAQFRNSNFKDGIHTLNTWLLKGEVQKRNAGTFFTIIQSLNHNIRRLLSEKEKHEKGNVKAKLLHRQKLHDISLQLEDFDKLFKLAEKQKNWDHFSKCQRKNIELWKKQTSEIKKANFEQLIDERIEDEMELSDEEDSVSEDFAKAEEARLLQKQVSEAESGISALQERNSGFRLEKNGALEAFSRNLNPHKNNLKVIQEDYEKHLALHKQGITITTKENPVTKPASSSSVEGFLKDACLLSLICQFLFVHPFAVNINYICSYLEKIVSPVSSSAYVTNLMRRFPDVFKERISGIGATLERKWSIIRYFIIDRL